MPVVQNKETHDNVDWYKLTEEVLSDIYLWLSDDGKNADKETFEEFTYSLAYYSTLFAIDFPELFVPYYFQLNFNVLELIASEFDIALPIIPIKKDYKGRFFYYGEVCFALKEFQRKYELDDYELDIDTWPGIPAYVEGEGKSEEELENILNMIALKKSMQIYLFLKRQNAICIKFLRMIF